MTTAPGDLRSIVIGADPLHLRRVFGLDNYLDVVQSYSGLDEVPDDLATGSISIIVVDMTLPDPTAATVIRQLATVEPTVGVVAATNAPLDEVLVARAVGAGAHACITPRTIEECGRAPFVAAAELRPFLPTEEVWDMLADENEADDLTSGEREARLRNLVLGLIPLTGVLAALIALLWRRYLGQIGVRPVDLAVDPATRITDVFFTISVLVGLIGPQVFVGSWIDLITNSASERVKAGVRRHRRLSRVVLSLLTFLVAVALAQFNQLLFALFVGPFVGALLLAKIFDLDDDLPAVLQISRLRPTRAMAGTAIIFAIFLALLSYEVVVQGPSFDESGEAGWIAPDVLGFNAEPMEVTAVDDGSVSEMLYLGGNADLYVLVDPCNDDRVDYVSVGATKMTVIDRVRCD